MGNAYWIVHLQFTLPPAALLSLLCWPLLHRIDAVKIVLLVGIAVTATIPWDSYLIRRGVWSYPGGGILGPTLFSIPVEELFFFVVQTYMTSLVYIICSKPVLHAQCLSSPATRPRWMPRVAASGQALLMLATALGLALATRQGETTYLGLMLAWACPFALITWGFAGEMVLSMPWTSTLTPIAAPTVYLWLVDELSLRNGVWTIEPGTKLDRTLFGSLDVEEALFFLLTNTLVVLGLVAFDQAVAVWEAFPDKFKGQPSHASLGALARARLMSPKEYDMKRVAAIREAVARLRRKSRTFSLASCVFAGRLRINLTLLYSYCRLADDLIDNAPTHIHALSWVNKLRQYLDTAYGDSDSGDTVLQQFITDEFPPSAHSALRFLPTQTLSPRLLYEMLNGFETDVEFHASESWPIHDEGELERYASRVASTVGGLCLDLVFSERGPSAASDTEVVRAAAHEMGIALQYVNIARDVGVDAEIGRVYLPTLWLEEEGLTPDRVVAARAEDDDAVAKVTARLLSMAFAKYTAARPQMSLLPDEARAPLIAAVENYMEIGRVLSAGGRRRGCRATVPTWRRATITWLVLMSG